MTDHATAPRLTSIAQVAEATVASTLPSGWEQTTLGEVTYVNARPNTSDLADETPVTFIPMAAVQEVCGKYDGSQTRSYAQVKKGYTPFRNGDLIFAKITPCMENGKAALVDQLLNGIGYGSTEFHVITATNALDLRYIFYLVTSKQFRGEAEHNMRGAAGQKRVPPQFLTGYPLALPPLAEQNRIVAKIEELFSKLDAGVAGLKRTQALLKRYRQSLLHAAVTGELTRAWREQQSDGLGDAADLLNDILAERRHQWQESGKKGKYKEPAAPDVTGLPELPDKWVWTSIGQAFEVSVGATPSRAKPEFWNGDIAWVSSGEVAFCRIKTTRERITAAGYSASSTKLHAPGTVLIGMIGEGKTRGQVALLDIEACNNQNSAAIKVSETPVSPEYVYFYLTSRYEESRRAGAGNNQLALNKSRVEVMLVPLPPLAEQAQIVAEVERRLSILDNMEATVAAELKRADSTRQSILTRAFSGRLVPQDPADEPASVLLERIQAEKLRTGAAAIRGGGGRGRKVRTAAAQPVLLSETAED